MEKEEVQKNDAIETKEGSYLTGIIGAIIGGIIATIPWILMYVYGNTMLSLLAALIAIGEFYGYKIFKGRIDKKLPAIIMILAIIIVVIATLLVTPAMLIQKEGLKVSFINIQKLYSNSEFSTAIVGDLIISVLFTILGASIVTSNVKKQLSKGNVQNIKLDLNNQEEITKIKTNAINLIKPIFEKYEATNKDKGILKEEVLAEIEDETAKNSFNYLKQLGIIKKAKGKYYYSIENENKQEKTIKTSRKISIISMAVIIIVAIFIGIFENISRTGSDTTISDGVVSFEINDSWISYDSEYEQTWEFYKYINTFPSVDDTESEDVEDYSSIPAFIEAYYTEIDTELITSIEDVKESMQSYADSLDDKPDVYETNIEKTANGYDMLTIKVVYETYPEEIIYLYYILNNDEMACITASSYCLEDSNDLKSESEILVNSFKWLN